MKKLTILGSTGSVGVNALSVVRNHPDHFSVVALSGNTNVSTMVEQCIEFSPRYVAMNSKVSASKVYVTLKQLGISTVEILSGESAICKLAALDEVDQVISAIVGAAGLLPTLRAIESHKQVLLANKEALVTCGALFMKALANSKAQLLPIDSEHSAIFQSLPLEAQKDLGMLPLKNYGVSQIILTGSGGPLRQIPLSELYHITPKQACNHPNWKMGPKISIDSATMMNKGLEYIEARWLFNASHNEIMVLIHPQSVIHSMVRYVDGNIIAQLGSADMRIPISYAMSYPSRINNLSNKLDLVQVSNLTFETPDLKRYPCLKLAIDACHQGQAATTILNAANEVAVNAFLRKRINFTDIYSVNSEVLSKICHSEPNTVTDIVEIDAKARKVALQTCKNCYS